MNLHQSISKKYTFKTRNERWDLHSFQFPDYTQSILLLGGFKNVFLQNNE